MAGHSQFKNIMHRKGRQDKAKSKLFGKLAREITVAAKLGLPDPAFNPRFYRVAEMVPSADRRYWRITFRRVAAGSGRAMYIATVPDRGGWSALLR